MYVQKSCWRASSFSFDFISFRRRAPPVMNVRSISILILFCFFSAVLKFMAIPFSVFWISMSILSFISVFLFGIAEIFTVEFVFSVFVRKFFVLK